MRSAARRNCCPYRSQCVPKAVKGPPSAASTRFFSASPQDSGLTERVFVFPFEIAECFRILWPTPTAVCPRVALCGLKPGNTSRDGRVFGYHSQGRLGIPLSVDGEAVY